MQVIKYPARGAAKVSQLRIRETDCVRMYVKQLVRFQRGAHLSLIGLLSLRRAEGVAQLLPDHSTHICSTCSGPIL
jgi:hypothetical protein